jgi:hypothetical protein
MIVSLFFYSTNSDVIVLFLFELLLHFIKSLKQFYFCEMKILLSLFKDKYAYLKLTITKHIYIISILIKNNDNKKK